MTFARSRGAFQVVLTVLLISLLAGCAGLRQEIQRPHVTLLDIRPAGGTMFAQDFDIDLRLTNPNDFALPLSGLNAALELNGRPFAEGVSSTPVTIPRLDSRTLTVRLSVTAFDIAREILQGGFLNDESGFDYALTGRAFLGDSFLQPSISFQETGAIQL